jgi:hypothetical protein
VRHRGDLQRAKLADEPYRSVTDSGRGRSGRG